MTHFPRQSIALCFSQTNFKRSHLGGPFKRTIDTTLKLPVYPIIASNHWAVIEEAAQALPSAQLEGQITGVRLIHAPTP